MGRLILHFAGYIQHHQEEQFQTTPELYLGVKKVAPPIQGFSVNLSSVVELIVREQRLHQLSSHALRLMMKLDGRPFWGKIL